VKVKRILLPGEVFRSEDAKEGFEAYVNERLLATI
jgi:hypothetical protein